MAFALAGFLMTSCMTTRNPASLAEFEAVLANQPSATAALDEWCARRGISDPATVRAVPVVGGEILPPTEVLARLAPAADETLGYRHVQLVCGSTVLSDAHNWFVRERLTAEMSEALAISDLPFGKVAAPLGYVREEIASDAARPGTCPPGTVLAKSALLRLPDGRALCVVAECYTAAVLSRP